MIIRFDRAAVERLLAHTRGAPAHMALYDANAEPGLWLVGDEAIYLLSNGVPQYMTDTSPPQNVRVYAEECHPDHHPDWYERKRAIWGGDDGAQFIPALHVETALQSYRPRDRHLMIEVLDESIGVVRRTLSSTRRRKAKVKT